ncbi:hypothetical protein [Sphingomonas montanisoli]|uniref:Uncharacterized protein n=1 Tax=Sphingomonas montanisoli TaxID=2606412 RepID=A0A5D9C278_9SPHN|nr:hypothetical protein [Sphingomonas montanisoli]TZG23965.1 hypothetical protein FYJ91_20400 [Sphingomonas montanisoli]
MTDEEFQQAQAAVEAERFRRATEQATVNAERLAPLVDLTSSSAFAAVADAVAALPLELVADAKIGPCINAIRVGMSGVMKFVPAPAQASASPPTA